MGFYIGIDCGTQGTKVIIYDSLKKQIVSTGYAVMNSFYGQWTKRTESAVVDKSSGYCHGPGFDDVQPR